MWVGPSGNSQVTEVTDAHVRSIFCLKDTIEYNKLIPKTTHKGG
jgi:hypothetical protein